MKTCALVAAVDFNQSMFMQLDSAGAFDAVMAVDAGYAHLKRIGRNPDFALGDFDSLGYEPQDVEIIRFPEEKDDSDLALALDWALCEGYGRVVIFGAFSGRLDHTLAAFQSMDAAAQSGMAVYGVASQCFIALLRTEVEYYFPPTVQVGEMMQGSKDKRTVSLIALSEKVEGLTIEGLKYELSGGLLTNTQTLGLSNEFTGKPASISYQRGSLLAFWPLSAGIPHIFDPDE